jgi:hypothetical protein
MSGCSRDRGCAGGDGLVKGWARPPSPATLSIAQLELYTADRCPGTHQKKRSLVSLRLSTGPSSSWPDASASSKSIQGAVRANGRSGPTARRGRKSLAQTGGWLKSACPLRTRAATGSVLPVKGPVGERSAASNGRGRWRHARAACMSCGGCGHRVVGLGRHTDPVSLSAGSRRRAAPVP